MREFRRRLERLEAAACWQDVDLATLAALPPDEMEELMRGMSDRELERIIEQADLLCAV